MSEIPDFIAKGAKVIARIGAFRINCFGHLGDGNLHLNVTTPGKFEVDDDVLNAIEPFVYAMCVATFHAPPRCARRRRGATRGRA